MGELSSNVKGIHLGMSLFCFFSYLFFFPAILLFSTYFSEYFARNLCVLLNGNKHVCSYMQLDTVVYTDISSLYKHMHS